MVGILAPALSDTAQPSFVLAAMLLGSYMDQRWPGTPGGPRSRYSYALLDEPELARFEPPLSGDARDPGALAAKMNLAVEELRGMLIDRETSDLVKETLAWSLGGPLAPERLERCRVDPAPLHTLARSQAARLLSAGPAFWRDYAHRFQSTALGGIGRWASYFMDPSHQVLLVLVPGR